MALRKTAGRQTIHHTAIAFPLTWQNKRVKVLKCRWEKIVADRKNLLTWETAAIFCLWRNSTSAGIPRPESNHLKASPPEMELLGGSGHSCPPRDCTSAEREAGHFHPWCGVLQGAPLQRDAEKDKCETGGVTNLCLIDLFFGRQKFTMSEHTRYFLIHLTCLAVLFPRAPAVVFCAVWVTFGT